MPNSDFSHCFSSSYHVGVFKQGKFHGTESKMHSLPLQPKHNLPSSFREHRTKCQILSLLSCDSLPQICSHHKFYETSIGREMIFARHISIRPEEKWAQENLTALIFAAGCRPPAPRSPLCTSLWVRRAPKLQRRRPAVLSEQPPIAETATWPVTQPAAWPSFIRDIVAAATYHATVVGC